MSVVREVSRYRDEPGARVLDLRREGVPFIAVLSKRECRKTMSGPRLHIHPGCLEIVYCVRGVLSFKTPSGDVDFLPGNIFTARENEPHCMKSNPKGLFVYRILVEIPSPSKSFLGLSRAESKWLSRQLMLLPRIFSTSGRTVRTAFERCFAAYDLPDRTSVRRTFVLRQAVYDLLLSFLSAAENASSGRIRPDVAAWARLMETDPQADYPSDRMSRDSGLSQNVFSRLFKEKTGLPPQAYLKVCRIRLAERWLREGKMSLSAIAHALKFCSTQYLATVFKSVTGKTPRDFRRS